MALPQAAKQVQCMYVWIDGSGENLRAKSRTVNFVPKAPNGKLIHPVIIDHFLTVRSLPEVIKKHKREISQSVRISFYVLRECQVFIKVE